MSLGFHRGRRGIVADLGAPERELLLSLLTQTRDLLAESTSAPAASPGASPEGEADEFEAMMRRAGLTDDATPVPGPTADDPAVRRLLPDGHHDDPEVAAEFRRFTEAGVRERKLGHLRRAVDLVAASDGSFALTEPQAVDLLISLTDVRLVLGDRLGLDDEETAEHFSDDVADMDPEDPMFGLALGYEFLTWLQETLAVALTP